MSALPPKADIIHHDCDVRFVPKADSCTATENLYRITLFGTRKQRVGHFEYLFLAVP
jgi:hypothetical protein